MTPDEAFTFLAASHTGILTTLRRDGTPIALPVWFALRNRRIYVATPAKTKKVLRIRNDDRVSFLTESGEKWTELKAVHVTGRARLVEDPPVIDAVGRLLDEKYAAFRTARRSMPETAQRHYSSGRAVIEIVPDERTLSWDNAKLKLERAP